MRLMKQGLIGFALIAVGATALFLRTQPKTVMVINPAVTQIQETLSASGRMRGETESSIGAPTGGRVAQVYVREGDRVHTGQLIARIDDEVLAAQVAQAQTAVHTAGSQLSEAEAAVKSAASQLQQAARRPLASDIERLRADNEQAVNVARAKLVSARQRQSSLFQRYEELKSGFRTEEIEQAATQAQQAEINLAQQQRDFQRQQSLYVKNVVARIEVERAETNYLVGKQTLDNARARLQQLQRGNRQETIAQAEADYLAAHADVAAAEASVTGAQRSGVAQMATLLATPRPEDVAVAQRRLEQATRSRDVAIDRLREAQSAHLLARRRYAESRIIAPFAGAVTQIVTEVGAIAGPNAPIVRLVRTGLPEIHADVDESNLGRLRVGQVALVTNDAFPDSRFQARVMAIGAQVDSDRGTIEVRLKPIDAPDWIRPGQTFTVNIVLEGVKERLVVPVSAVHNVAGLSTIMLVEHGRVVKKPIKAGPLAAKGVPVFDGLTVQSQVVLHPEGIAEGERVAVASVR